MPAPEAGADVWSEDSPCKDSPAPSTLTGELGLWSRAKISIAEGQACFLCAFPQPRGVSVSALASEDKGEEKNLENILWGRSKLSSTRKVLLAGVIIK